MDDVRKPDGDAPIGVISRPRLQAEQTVLSEAGRAWADANKEAIADFNDWYARNGSPLDRYRRF